MVLLMSSHAAGVNEEDSDFFYTCLINLKTAINYFLLACLVQDNLQSRIKNSVYLKRKRYLWKYEDSIVDLLDILFDSFNEKLDSEKNDLNKSILQW